MMKGALVYIAVGVLTYFFYTVYRARSLMYRLRAQGKVRPLACCYPFTFLWKQPMPPYNWATGHLLIIKGLVDKLPTDAVFNYVALNISRTFTKHDMFYLDFWPFMTPILVIKNPHVAGQIMGRIDAQKPVTVRDAFVQMTGGDSLLTMAEQPWKQWRSIFAPGFSLAHMLDQVPLIVDQGKTFCGKLREAARNGTLLQLEEATIRLTIDVISLVALNVRLNYQLQDGQFPSTMRSLIETVTFGQDLNPLQRWNPIRPLLVWKYGRTLDRYIRGELAKRFEERRSLIRNRDRTTDERIGKSIASLALDEYIAKHMQTENAKLDSDFERYASAQIRLFLVAGHDTTSSALTYTLHLLYKHPEFLASVRAEHDSVFGTDAGAAADILSNDPTLLNQLPITSAAIKESLRLFPPAGGVREGSPDITLVAEDGTQYPTDGCAIWVPHEAIHRSPVYWPRADEFVPDRFLCAPEDPLYPTKGAWRAFELGPHSCIGQTLALTEIKTLLVMVVRHFDLLEAYAEWDQSHPVVGLRKANGERAYQVSGGGGGQHPSCRYPCRISIRE